MTRRRLPTLATLAALLVLLVIGVAPARRASPGFEVKFFLDPGKTLDASNRPTQDVLATFNAAGPLAMKMQFLDGPKLELHNAGWNVRFRTVEGDNEMELTYKRRYPVPTGLDAALERAERDGFDDKQKDAEVEWGYQQRTLTFSMGPTPSPNAAIPPLADARASAVSKMPDKLRSDGWARGILSGASLYGPVEGKRWKGGRDGVDKKISIEVWVLPGACQRGEDRVVEVSFKEGEPDKAEKKRLALYDLLEKKGWLLPRDVLKTSLILDRVPGIR